MELISKYNLDGNNKFGSRDTLREDTNNMNEKYEEKMELVDEVFYYDKTGTIKNQSVVSVLGENLIKMQLQIW